ncbi:MAG: 4-hydroxy-tetrahydrodipicolinate reductase [Pseudomonadota bacterium]
MIKIGVLGIAGRMGQAIMAEIFDREGAQFAGGCDSLDHPRIGETLRHPATGEALDLVIGNTPAELFLISDVLIDFSAPDALEEHLVLAAGQQKPLIIGTTGLNARHHSLIDDVAQQVPIMQAANTSMGVNLLAKLVADAAAALDDSWDIEILDMHHRAKVDAPSGTALLLGEKAAEARSQDASAFTLSREGNTGPRETGTIGYATLRGGDVAGEHSVIFAAGAERLELSHKATDRRIFAGGAVTAAQWIHGLPAARYTMEDVLGLR